MINAAIFSLLSYSGHMNPIFFLLLHLTSPIFTFLLEIKYLLLVLMFETVQRAVQQAKYGRPFSLFMKK